MLTLIKHVGSYQLAYSDETEEYIFYPLFIDAPRFKNKEEAIDFDLFSWLKERNLREKAEKENNG